jgi:putative endonuclease
VAATRAELGRLAEEAVARELVARDWLVLGRNVRVGRLEIDVVARQGSVVAIVEVRTRGRTSWQGPLASVNASKRARLRTAGERLWRARFIHDASIERMRFDIAAVTFTPEGEAQVEYVTAAF